MIFGDVADNTKYPCEGVFCIAMNQKSSLFFAAHKSSDQENDCNYDMEDGVMGVYVQPAIKRVPSQEAK